MQKKILNIAIAVCAIAAISASYADDLRWFWVLKPLTTILIFLLPLLFTDGLPSDFSHFRKKILVALLFCLAGDVFLLNDEYFALGLGSFLIAHVLFAYVFYKLSNKKLYLLPLVVLLAIALTYYSILFPKLGSLALPVAVYFCCIIVMCWQSFRLGLSLKNAKGLGFIIATNMFVISDSVIAANKFLVPFSASSIIVLALYWLSITLLANLFSGPDIHSKMTPSAEA